MGSTPINCIFEKTQKAPESLVNTRVSGVFVYAVNVSKMPEKHMKCNTMQHEMQHENRDITTYIRLILSLAK